MNLSNEKKIHTNSLVSSEKSFKCSESNNNQRMTEEDKKSFSSNLTLYQKYFYTMMLFCSTISYVSNILFSIFFLIIKWDYIASQSLVAVGVGPSTVELKYILNTDMNHISLYFTVCSIGFVIGSLCNTKSFNSKFY